MVSGDDGISTDVVIINTSIIVATRTTVSNTEAGIIKTHLWSKAR